MATTTLSESILIQVLEFSEGKFWTVCAHKYQRDDSLDNPELFDDTEDYFSEADAVRNAEDKARWIIDTRQARRATVLKNGNEHLCLVLPE